MIKKQKQNKTARKIGFAMIANVIIIFIFVFGFGREYLSNMQVEREIKELEAEYAELQEERLSTLNLINELSSEYYLETQARTKHGLVKDGEEVIIIKDSDEISELAYENGGLLDSIAPEGIGNPLRWYFYFFVKVKFEELASL